MLAIGDFAPGDAKEIDGRSINGRSQCDGYEGRADGCDELYCAIAPLACKR